MSKSGRLTRDQVPHVIREGRAAHGQGKLNEAERIYRSVLEVDPQQAEALQLLGVLLCQKERVPQGLEMLKKAVLADPGYAEAHANYAVALQAQGKFAEALPLIARACELNPKDAHAANGYGFVLFELGRFPEALIEFDRALTLAPNRPDIHFNRANALRELGQPDESEKAFLQALKLAPGYGEAMNNLGALYSMLGRFDEAERRLKMAIQVGFRTGQVLSNLAVVKVGQGKRSEAEKLFKDAVRAQPGHMHAYQELAALYHQSGELHLSIEVLDTALRVKPNDLETLKLWARITSELGDCRKARARLRSVPDLTCRLMAGLIQPSIAESLEEIEESREALREAVRESEGLTMRDPHDALRMTPFFLAYHGLPERELVEAFVGRVRQACPMLDSRPAFTREARKEGGRIRIGVVTAHFRNHTISKIFSEMILRLDRDQFEVIFFDACRSPDAVTERISSRMDKTVRLGLRLDVASAQIEAERIDVLVYPELGMDNFVWYLAQVRLARKQLVTWGHPMTSGSPAIDVFLSSVDLEVPDGQRLYTERLVTTPTLNTFFLRPEIPDRLPGRAELGLPEGKRLIGSPQSLFKFHPEGDALLGEILRRDEDAVLVLLNAAQASWESLLRTRLQKSIPDVADRIIVLPRMPFESFLGLCKECTVLLDPLHFGGGTTTLEFSTLGVPCVTWPQDQLRNRITHAIYRSMGLEGLSVDSGEAFVERTVEFATRAEAREDVSRQILERNGVLYSNENVVREFAAVLASLADEAPSP